MKLSQAPASQAHLKWGGIHSRNKSNKTCWGAHFTLVPDSLSRQVTFTVPQSSICFSIPFFIVPHKIPFWDAAGFVREKKGIPRSGLSLLLVLMLSHTHTQAVRENWLKFNVYQEKHFKGLWWLTGSTFCPVVLQSFATYSTVRHGAPPPPVTTLTWGGFHPLQGCSEVLLSGAITCALSLPVLDYFIGLRSLCVEPCNTAPAPVMTQHADDTTSLKMQTWPTARRGDTEGKITIRMIWWIIIGFQNYILADPKPPQPLKNTSGLKRNMI